MSLFFIGLNPRYQSYQFLPIGLNVMFSAAGFWDHSRRRWRKGHRFQQEGGYHWLDMGGFTALNRWGRYPFTVGNAMNLVAYLAPDFYATMDYPCEPEINRLDGLSSNRERIELTVQNAQAMAEMEEMVPGSIMVPVIQGYTLEEYKYCIDLYREAGLIRDYMAVGSMCRRINSAELHTLIPEIAKYAARAGCTKLHFFGLKLSPALEDLDQYIWSRDSAVALDAYDAELRAKRNGRRWPRGQEEKRAAFVSFLGRVEDLNLEHSTLLIRSLPRWIKCQFSPIDLDCLAEDGEIDNGTYWHIMEEFM